MCGGCWTSVRVPATGHFIGLPAFPLEERGDLPDALRKLGRSKRALQPLRGAGLFAPNGVLIERQPALADADARAQRLLDSHPGVVVASLIGAVGDSVLWKTEAVWHRQVDEQKAFDQLLDATEQQVLDALAHDRTEKALDPTNRRDMLVLEQLLQRRLAGAFGPTAREHVVRVVAKLSEIDWKSLGDRGLKLIARAVNDAIPGLPPVQLQQVELSLRGVAQQIFTGNAARLVDRFGDLSPTIATSIRQVERDAIQRMVGVGSFYARDGSGALSARLTAEAQRIVAKGLRQGLGTGEIARSLEQQLGPGYSRRQANYWNVVSSNFCNRARERSSAALYSSIDVQYVRAVAVQDERTTEWCRMLDGQVIDVRQSGRLIEEVDALPNPTDVRQVNPWITMRGNEMGVQRGGDWTALGRVDRPGAGTWGKGDYTQLVGSRELASVGVGYPPYHGLCRTWTEIDVEYITRSAVGKGFGDGVRAREWTAFGGGFRRLLVSPPLPAPECPAGYGLTADGWLRPTWALDKGAPEVLLLGSDLLDGVVAVGDRPAPEGWVDRACAALARSVEADERLATMAKVPAGLVLLADGRLLPRQWVVPGNAAVVAWGDNDTPEERTKKQEAKPAWASSLLRRAWLNPLAVDFVGSQSEETKKALAEWSVKVQP